MPFTPIADLPPPRPPMECLRPPSSAMELSRPDLPYSITSEKYPLRVHWDDTFDKSDALAVIGYAEIAWEKQVIEIGFREPVLPDNVDGEELDIYMSKTVGEWAGWTVTDVFVDADPSDGSFGVPAYILLGDIAGGSWMASYVAHEFNHVTEYATDSSEWTSPIWESVATAAQKWTFGKQDYVVSMTAFQAAPWAPTFMGDSDALYNWEPNSWGFEYGGVIWVHYLDEVLGNGDGKQAAALWEAVANDGWSYEKDVLDGITTLVGDLGVAINGVALTRFLVGDDWDERGIEDLREWQGESIKVPIDYTLERADLPQSLSFEMGPMVMGTSYTELSIDGEAGNLTAAVSSDGGLSTALLIFWWKQDGTVGQIETSGFNPSLSLPLEGIGRAVVAVSNMGDEAFDCDWDNPYQRGDQILTLTDDAAPTPDTGSDDTDTTKPLHADEPSGDCGCSTQTTPIWTLWLTVCCIALGRRHRVSPRRVFR